MIGKTIRQYEILSKLGEGGMGVVYKAADTKLHRDVALKFLPTNLLQDDEAKERFINEARAASALDHANICTLHEINDTHDGQMYIAMAYYDGQTLKEKISARANGRSPLPIAEAVNIAIQVAKGLARAHEKGIVHRDIKPANIMVTDHGEVKILDFGLAKLTQLTQMTRSGTTLGTVAYMSPEQAQGISIDQRTDIWSLGVVLYEMLTGKQPFEGEYDQAIVYSLINEKHQPLSEVARSVPEQLEAIVDHALAKKPGERYQTAEEMLADLLVVSNTLDSPATGQESARLKIRRRSRIKPPRPAIIIAGVLFLAVGLWFFLGRGTRKESVDTVSVAVLPLKGFGEEVSEDWFRDSMTDALITDLTKVGGLRVISQNSTMRYKDSDKSIPTIGEELRVEYVIDASIIKVGDQIRLSAKLVNAPTNENIWAENYQRNFQNVLAVQADFAQAIARQVNVRLTLTEQQRFDEVQEVDPEAYSAYLRGRYLSSSSASRKFEKSFDEFRNAIKLAPEFAAAYAGLADAYVGASSRGLLPPKEGFSQAKETAFQALSLDPGCSEAYSALGYAGLLLDKGWQATEKNLLKAIQLNPSNKLALQWYAVYLTAVGRHEEAIATIKKAVRLDPVSPDISSLEGLLYYFSRDYEQATKVLNRALVTHPNFSFAYYWLACAQTELQLYDEAMENIEKALELNPQDPGFFLRNWLGKLYARIGQRQEALEIVNEIEEQGGEASFIYIELGEKDKAFVAIEQWFENQYSVPLFKVAPWYDPIRSDPRFQQVLKKAGLENGI